MAINKDLRGIEREQLEAMLDDIGVVLSARRVARRRGFDRLDDMEIEDVMMNIMDEIARRNTEDEVAMMIAHYKEVL